MGDFTRICPESAAGGSGALARRCGRSRGFLRLGAAVKTGETCVFRRLAGLADANALALALDLQLAHAAFVEQLQQLLDFVYGHAGVITGEQTPWWWASGLRSRWR